MRPGWKEHRLKIKNSLRALFFVLLSAVPTIDAQAADAQSSPTTMTAKPTPPRITVPQTVLPLPGGLDETPFFNSNSPEVVLQSGILLSTFPPDGKAHPAAHLNYPLTGRFDLFFHHITNASKTGTKRTLYLGLLIGNASSKKVHIEVMDAISHSTKPDAPFKELSPVLDNERGSIYAGPGDRVMTELLREMKQHGWHQEITLDPGEVKVLQCLPLPVKSLLQPLNGRTGVIRLNSDGPVYLASLSAFGERRFFIERKPGLDKWKQVLNSMPLVEPRDKTPSVPGAKGQLIYGRVAGIARGSTWRGTLTNDEKKERLAVTAEQMISFPINTVAAGTFGTNQVQAAPMMVRYPDTAYQAHGNYGLLYDLTVPLHNNSNEPITVGLSFQTPLKDWHKSDSLQFFTQPPEQIFFRGTVAFDWTDEFKKHHQKMIHLVEKRGQSIRPLVEVSLKPHSTQEVRFRFLYPADCTPPHVLTITTIGRAR